MMNKQQWIIFAVLTAMLALVFAFTRTTPSLPQTAHQAQSASKVDYLRAEYSPLHFQPAIATATDAQCLACHREVLEDKVQTTSPAGVPADTSLAWYQQLATYQGAQDTFHRRHLVSDYAQKVMSLKCNTCHQGHNPRDEAPGTAAPSPTSPSQQNAQFTLRKQVDPNTCLMCHGQYPWQNMGLTGPWPEQAKSFNNSCLDACHSTIRTQRHQVNYLKADAIEAAGKQNADACYGCHGGRAWYRISYPYPRHPWPGMADAVPDWAKNRPTESAERFTLASPATSGRTFKP